MIFIRVRRLLRGFLIAAYPVCLSYCTRGEFNNARARRALVDWYLSLFVMFKAWHQYNEHLKALALLNSPRLCALLFVVPFSNYEKTTPAKRTVTATAGIQNEKYGAKVHK